MKNIFIVSLAVVALSGCATTEYGDDGSRTSVTIQKTDSETMEVIAPTNPNEIIVTESDITDRSYIALGDLKVSASKLTVFNKDPTREDINKRLRGEAAKLGADAVILVRYGNAGIGLTSWGTMKGNGRAIKFSDD